VSRSVLARAPPDASYSATWSRTHPYGLGSYSPTSGMSKTVAKAIRGPGSLNAPRD
jgi:hypothetical protein